MKRRNFLKGTAAAIPSTAAIVAGGIKPMEAPAHETPHVIPTADRYVLSVTTGRPDNVTVDAIKADTDAIMLRRWQ